MLIQGLDNALNCIIFGIYVSAQLRDKDEFWNHLIELNNFRNLPWCLIGDFNEILCVMKN